MIKWQWRPFNELSTQMLYDILQLREAVFQIEQRSIYQDCDDLDQHAEHLVGYNDKQLIAYLRIQHKNNTITIARIVTTKENRGKGLGEALLQECLNYIKRKFPHADVEMSAQTYLQKFYNKLGFISVGSPYDDGGVEHIKMKLQEQEHEH